MATLCRPEARGKVIRITKLDACGAPVEGATSTLVTKSFVSVQNTPNYTDPEEIQQLDANGDICVDDQTDPAFRWIDLTITLCTTDPFFVNLVTGDPLVVDDATPTPNTVGWRIDSDLTGTANFALEVWTGITGQACDPGGFPEYGYWLYPWVTQARWGEWTIENGPLLTTFTARTKGGSGWGVGPYNIRRDATTPATLEPLLTAIGPTTHLHRQVTTLAPPTPACGAIVLPPAP